ncbi:MAG: hypothetical protein ACHQT9_04155 [Candidatus Saccharimonadales bacterium]
MNKAKLADVSGDKEIYIQIIAWFLVATVSILAVVGWAGYFQWHIFPISTYQFFPVLGLLAFSILWTHYIIVFLKTRWSINRAVTANYFRWTGYAVLALICLHPGLLIYQRFRDGYGLPPHSYETYVAPGLGWITLVGTTCLLIFLAFELHRFFGKKSWWHYVSDASDLAMLGIAYHSLRLGTTLQQGWLRYVWYFYVVTLVMVLLYKYINRYLNRSAEANT